MMRKLFSVTFALVVLLSMAISAGALEFKAIERHNSESAYASWSETKGDITTYTDLSVTKSDDGTDIYVSTSTYGPDFWSGKSGYMFTKDNVFTIKNNLNSASLSEVKIDVYDWNTGAPETLTVKADWIGKGEVSKGSSRYSSTNGDYTFKTSDSSSYRDASATGSINNCDLGLSFFGGLTKSKTVYMSMNK